MKTASLCLFGGALLGAGLSSTANADISISDDLIVLESHNSGYGYDYIGLGSDGYGSDFAYNQGLVELDTFDFTVLSDGNVIIDALSWASFSTFFDTQIKLFHNDGNVLDSNNYIAGNDDFGYINLGGYGDTNGSVSGLDSFMDIFLLAGDYTVVMGGYYYEVDEVADGASLATVLAFPSEGIPDFGEYQLDIIGNVRPTVPTPGALALLGMGGLLGSRRRR